VVGGEWAETLGNLPLPLPISDKVGGGAWAAKASVIDTRLVALPRRCLESEYRAMMSSLSFGDGRSGGVQSSRLWRWLPDREAQRIEPTAFKPRRPGSPGDSR
jgi:hypothetical protein